ncbi:MAG: glycosyltransferase family 39 protein [Candidatus Marsarchaeota archaeon]|nr:glycosyltransferase family 39 protein [Candidatus Marsarchaeota archaeon]
MHDLLLGYAITGAVYASFLLLLACVYMARKDISGLLRRGIDRYSLAILAAVIAFFLIFALVYVSPVEQLYFDENIYQGIAINILHNGNALWCQFGTGHLTSCSANALYHDPVGWSAFLAIAFAIFGIGIQTAYALELLCGVLSILFIFLLASVMWERRGFAAVAALAMSVMPGLFIWSRTQADFDLPFMMLAILTFFFFMVFVRKKGIYTLGAFAFSLSLTAYMRIEAILLVPLFALLLVLFGEQGVKRVLRERLSMIKQVMLDNTKVLLLLLAFILLLLPQVYYVAVQAQQPSYGQPSSQAVVSLSNFMSNIGTNSRFLVGLINGSLYYPAAFHYAIFPLALVGVAVLLLRRKLVNRFGTLLMLGLWFLAYFLFYTAFYAGSVTYGVDSRFMLQILPPLCLLAAYALIGIGDAAAMAMSRFRKNARIREGNGAAFYAVLTVASIVLLVLPFAFLAPTVALPPSEMPQQAVILNAMNTFYNSYNAVPANCLVFSFTPDIWYEVNRSSAQIGYLMASNQTIHDEISSYSCLVLDYGYWCVVPPYHSTTCAYALNHFKLENLTPVSPNNTGVAFYRILNYS